MQQATAQAITGQDGAAEAEARSAQVPSTVQSTVIPDPETQFQSVQVSFSGRLMLRDGAEHDAEVTEMSPGSATIACDARPALGERVVAYVDHVGRIEGRAWRIHEGGFGMTVDASHRKRDRIAAQLTWFANRDELSLPEDRRHGRERPSDTKTTLRLPDGRAYPCTIIDLSVSGAAVQIDVRPARGTPVVLGTMRGKVARHFDGGCAIEFAKVLAEAKL